MYGFQGKARIFAESRKKSALGWSRYVDSTPCAGRKSQGPPTLTEGPFGCAILKIIQEGLITQVLVHVSTSQGNPFRYSGFLSHSHMAVGQWLTDCLGMMPAELGPFSRIAS